MFKYIYINIPNKFTVIKFSRIISYRNISQRHRKQKMKSAIFTRSSVLFNFTLTKNKIICMRHDDGATCVFTSRYYYPEAKYALCDVMTIHWTCNQSHARILARKHTHTHKRYQINSLLHNSRIESNLLLR